MEREVFLWGESLLGYDCGERVSLFLKRLLGIKSSLVFLSKRRKRAVPGHKNYNMSFVDSSQLLVLSEESIEKLNSKLVQVVGMDRFRPNIVLKGGQPFEEDQLEEYSIGEAKLKNVANVHGV